MKALPTIIIMCTMSLTLFAQTSTPLRCKSNTRWGQCTNEAVTSDTLCTLHRQLTVASQSQSATSRTVTMPTKAATKKIYLSTIPLVPHTNKTKIKKSCHTCLFRQMSSRNKERYAMLSLSISWFAFLLATFPLIVKCFPS